MRNKFALLTIFLFACILLSAQAPEKFNYQAVARNNSGQPLSNQNISVKISIRSGSASGTVVYSETHAVTTNQFGLFTLAIGGGTPVSGTLGAIDWSANSYFAETEIDPAGGSNYTSLGTVQLLSVPYALYAKDGGPWVRSGNNISNTNSGNVGIGTTSPTARLDVVLNGGGTLASLKRTGTVSSGEMMKIETDTIGGNQDLLSLNVPTSAPNNAQFIEFERDGAVVAQINTNGDFKTNGEYNRNATGTANVVALAYGTVSATGTLQSGTSNVTVTKAGTGIYDITIAGESYVFTNYTTVATLLDGPAFIFTNSIGGTKLRVFTYNSGGTAADKAFGFVTFKE